MNKRKKTVPMIHGPKPRVPVTFTIDPDKLVRVNKAAGKRGRSRFMDEAVDLRLAKGNVTRD